MDKKLEKIKKIILYNKKRKSQKFKNNKRKF